MDASLARIIKPIPIHDLALLSSNVPSTIQPIYSAVTTYAADVLVGTMMGTVQSVYKSKFNGNLNHAPATSPDWWEPVGVVYEQYDPNKTYHIGDVVQLDNPFFTVTIASMLVSAVAHFREDGEALTLSTTGTLPPEYSTGVEYFIVQATTNSYKLSKTKGGQPIVASSAGAGVHTATMSSHRVYESIADNHFGSTPYKTLGTSWLKVGEVNKYQMFDAAYQSQTQNMGSIDVSLRTAGLVNAVEILNSEGVSATVTQVESGYTKTLSLRRHPVNNRYDFYFTDPIFVDDASFEDIPPVVNGTLNVTIDGGTGVAKCGVLVAGARTIMGKTEDGLNREVDDFSVAKANEWGEVNLVVRPISQKLRMDIVIDKEDASMVSRYLEKNRASELVVIGVTGYSMTYIYGFIGPWNISLKNAKTILNIQFKGLT